MPIVKRAFRALSGADSSELGPERYAERRVRLGQGRAAREIIPVTGDPIPLGSGCKNHRTQITAPVGRRRLLRDSACAYFRRHAQTSRRPSGRFRRSPDHYHRSHCRFTRCRSKHRLRASARRQVERHQVRESPPRRCAEHPRSRCEILPMSTERKSGHGGRRPGAGRPKGSIDRFTSRNLKHFRERYPISAARSHDEHHQRAGGHQGRDGRTGATNGSGSGALPASTIVRARARKGGAGQYSMDITKLNDDELMALLSHRGAQHPAGRSEAAHCQAAVVLCAERRCSHMSSGFYYDPKQTRTIKSRGARPILPT